MATNTTQDSESDPECGTMRIEAEDAIKEIKFAVAFAELSSKLSRSDDLVYINLQIKEGETYCVELCIQGFRVSYVFVAIIKTMGLKTADQIHCFIT